MLYWVSRFIIWLTGWKIKGEVPPLKKFVIIAAPHTSAWDVLYGLCAIHIFKLRLTFFVKEEIFRTPLGPLFRAFGGIPVNRFSKHNLVEQSTKMFNENENFILALAPEGTREYVSKWKSGFYYIAQSANVPVVLSYLDFGNKIVGIGPTFYLTGNADKDIEEIKNFYKPIKGKHPEKGVR